MRRKRKKGGKTMRAWEITKGAKKMRGGERRWLVAEKRMSEVKMRR